MKALQFTIPVQHDKSILARIDNLPHFYPYLHRHQEMQITWVQRGDGTLMVNNNMHMFESNDIFIIGANQPHLFKSSASYFLPKSKKSICSLDIFFNPDLMCNTLLNIPELKQLRGFLQLCQTGFKIPAKKIAAVSAKMLLINQVEEDAIRVLHFIELLQMLVTKPLPKKLSNDPATLFNNENDGMRISHIYNYILQNYHCALMLEDVAQEACMTPQAFCRFFKKHTRHTFIGFLNEVRINEARRQFAVERFDSIAGVAYKCGFNSITHFNRIFKSIVKQTPSAYLQSLNAI